jgi:GNAT superfamily N-acetyltransferase
MLVTTYYLETLRPADLRKPARAALAELTLVQAKVPCPELNRFLYTAVGRDWTWIDRLPWSREQWMRYLARPELETWVGYDSGTPCGYFEIAYFGLLPQFTGRGLGGHLLAAAIERGWAMGAARVWVHTCTLDHPAALGNYQARGMKLYREVTEEKEVPEAGKPGPF